MENSDLKINESTFPTEHGEGKIAVFLYTGPKDPDLILDDAVRAYVGNEGYHELIDSHMDNPFMRVVVTNIKDMPQANFNFEKGRLSQVQ